MALSDELDIELAWKKHRYDLKTMSFSDNPFEELIIEDNFSEWSAKLRDQLNDYTPSSCEIIDIPKKRYHLRPGAILTTKDSIVFQALLLKDIDKIRENLLWSASKGRFSNILKEDQTSKYWFVNEFQGWSSFREQSSSYLDEGYRWIVFADIAGFFENISIQRLISDLKGFSVTQEVLDSLSSCLHRWAEPRARGIPQGNRPGFILAEVYLNSIDKRLHNKNIKFCRYVDDTRLFFKTKDEAIGGLHLLTTLLREKELNLQTSKSFILSDDKAKIEIDGISTVIDELEDNIKNELKEATKIEFPYITPSGLENLLSKSASSIELMSLRKAFKLLETGEIEFNKTLFHYCINRFGATNDDFAVEFCMNCIKDLPEEFRFILPYFSKLKEIRVELTEQMLTLFSNVSTIIEWNHFLLLRWIYQKDICSSRILEFCRDLALSEAVRYNTKHYAWAMLGKYGDSSDLDSIEAEYSSVTREVSKSAIFCTIRKMVTDRRNSVYSRAVGDGELVKYTIKTVKKNAID